MLSAITHQMRRSQVLPAQLRRRLCATRVANIHAVNNQLQSNGAYCYSWVGVTFESIVVIVVVVVVIVVVVVFVVFYSVIKNAVFFPGKLSFPTVHLHTKCSYCVMYPLLSPHYLTLCFKSSWDIHN